MIYKIIISALAWTLTRRITDDIYYSIKNRRKNANSKPKPKKDKNSL